MVVLSAHNQKQHAAGLDEAARETIGQARERLLARAQRIVDPALRQSFLERVPEHARTLSLARQWLGAGAAGEAS